MQQGLCDQLNGDAELQMYQVNVLTLTLSAERWGISAKITSALRRNSSREPWMILKLPLDGMNRSGRKRPYAMTFLVTRRPYGCFGLYIVSQRRISNKMPPRQKVDGRVSCYEYGSFLKTQRMY